MQNDAMSESNKDAGTAAREEREDGKRNKQCSKCLRFGDWRWKL
jgi:hypothetical protein